MSDVIVMPSAAVERLRRKAKQVKKETGVAHHDALDIVAREFGHFPDWHHLIEAARATEPAERAYKTGLVIGMDVKDADGAKASRLTHFISDERLLSFVLAEFGLHETKPWTQEEEWHLQLLHQTVFFRSRQIVPDTLEEAEELTRKEFFFRPEYLRLKGKLLVDPFDDGFEDDGGDDV